MKTVPVLATALILMATTSVGANTFDEPDGDAHPCVGTLLFVQQDNCTEEIIVSAPMSEQNIPGDAPALEPPAELYVEEITVSAQMSEQNIQDVPIAISAFDMEFLNEAGIKDIRELTFYVPGLTVISEQSPVQTNINIRGVGTPGDNLALESSVALYVDGVYRSRQSSTLNNLVDIERVEVLKGPQGTFFGKNAVSGAIQYISVAPQLDESDWFLEVSGGSESYGNINGAVNIPLIEGKAAARLSGGLSKRDGYVDNIVADTDMNNQDRYAIRAQLLWNPTDHMTARIIADRQEMNEKCCSQSIVLNAPVDYAIRDDFGGVIVLEDEFDEDISAGEFVNYVDIKESGVSAEINWGVGGITVTSLTAYREYEAENGADVDNTSLFTINNIQLADQNTFTQEFRMAGSAGDRINYIGGFYYFDQVLDGEMDLPIGPDLNAIFGNPTNSDFLGGDAACVAAGLPAAECDDPVFIDGDLITSFETQAQTSWAVFAQADFNMTDELIMTIGLRYLDEKKELDTRYLESRFNPAWGGIVDFSPFVPDIEGAKFDDTAVTGTAKLTYHWNGDIMTYASYGRGYKSGGTNGRRLDPDVSGSVPLEFKPEKSDSYEVGLKGGFLDNRMRVDVATFYTRFKDFQANSFTGVGFILQNAGKISSKGVELDATVRATEWLTLSSGVSHIDAEYDSFVGSSCITSGDPGSSPDIDEPNFPNTCDASGNKVHGTPEWSGFGSVGVEHGLDDGNMLYGRLDASWRDETPISPENDPNKTLDSYTLTNLRFGYRFSEARYDVSLWAKNLFDEDYNKGPYNTTFRSGGLTDNHTDPRTFGVTLRVAF